MHLPQPRALKQLEKDNASLDEEISSTATTADETEKEMNTLKGLLYSKFGSAINLDE
jgi:prefoldin subunit 4